MHALLRGVRARDLLRCRRRRYNSGIGSSSALHLTHLSAARDERHRSATSYLTAPSPRRHGGVARPART